MIDGLIINHILLNNKLCNNRFILIVKQIAQKWPKNLYGKRRNMACCVAGVPVTTWKWTRIGFWVAEREIVTGVFQRPG